MKQKLIKQNGKQENGREQIITKQTRKWQNEIEKDKKEEKVEKQQKTE